MLEWEARQKKKPIRIKCRKMHFFILSAAKRQSAGEIRQWGPRSAKMCDKRPFHVFNVRPHFACPVYLIVYFSPGQIEAH